MIEVVIYIIGSYVLSYILLKILSKYSGDGEWDNFDLDEEDKRFISFLFLLSPLSLIITVIFTGFMLYECFGYLLNSTKERVAKVALFVGRLTRLI